MCTKKSPPDPEGLFSLAFALLKLNTAQISAKISLQKIPYIGYFLNILRF